MIISFKTGCYYRGINPNNSYIVFKIIKKDNDIARVEIIKDYDEPESCYAIGTIMTLHFDNAIASYFSKAKLMDYSEVLALVL